MKKELEALIATLKTQEDKLDAIEAIRESSPGISYHDMLKEPGLYMSTDADGDNHLIVITRGASKNYYLEGCDVEELCKNSWVDDRFVPASFKSFQNT